MRSRLASDLEGMEIEKDLEDSVSEGSANSQGFGVKGWLEATMTMVASSCVGIGCKVSSRVRLGVIESKLEGFKRPSV